MAKKSPFLQGDGDSTGQAARRDFDEAVRNGSPEMLIGFLAKYEHSEFDAQVRELAKKALPDGTNLDSIITVYRQTHNIKPTDTSEPSQPTSSREASDNTTPPGPGTGQSEAQSQGDGGNGTSTPAGQDKPTTAVGGGQPVSGEKQGATNPSGGTANPSGVPATSPNSTVADPPTVDEVRWDNKVMAKEDPIRWLASTMVKVKSGTFKMGCSLKLETTGCAAAAEPSHEVKVADFNISRFEVTQALWSAVMGERKNPSRFDDCDLCPVEQVSWNAAQDFIKKLNRMTGGSYRMPTEAEWEYAARQAGKDNRFGDGTNIAMTTNFNFNSEDLPERKFVVKGETRGRTVDVFMMKANGLGLYNMSGNVAEWCEDLWHPDYEGAPADGSAWLEGNDNRRVIRGGGWDNEPYAARTYDRDAKKASTGDDEVGLRLVW
ncbi:MAG: SUMF1/EgtB/PvdO family nonheme iron enzyme [Saprospiraceae bacterium]|nr:SUMF1/EgtB/PvdO family nonheme iron enzyme [Saprospiraceae bacterium]